MTTTNVKEPKSGNLVVLQIKEITNAPYPGWVVFIPHGRNIFIYKLNGRWTIQPNVIPISFINAIGEKIRSAVALKANVRSISFSASTDFEIIAYLSKPSEPKNLKAHTTQMAKNTEPLNDHHEPGESGHMNTYIKDSEGLLQSIFDTSLIGMSLLQAQRGLDGEIEDFRIKIVNKELERETGRNDLVGKLYAKEYPGIREAGLFELMLKVMDTGVPEQMEYFYPHDGFNKWFSCMFVKLDDGLVATNLDISSRKKAEEERLKMVVSQNQKIYWATLNIQEIERKRIAESLHNGVGQLLYGVKMSLLQDFNKENLDTEQLLEQIEEISNRTDKLLDEAIKETRRISHELTPAILEEYGLKEAISEVCRQFRQNLDISCSFTGLVNKIDKLMELAIYRIVQELVMNIIKHSHASKASVKINIDKKNVGIMVSDNGIGFSKKGKHEGIGLKTIQNKINLLNGTFKLESNSRENSIVTILIPYIHI